MRIKIVLRIALVTAFILLIPFAAMLFTDEVNWSLTDFIIMGGLLFCSGLMYEWASGRRSNTAYRIAAGIAVGTALLLTWVNLAVGLIGSGVNPANVMYFGVLFVGIIGAIAARLHANGMSYALFGMALAQILVPLITLIFWKQLLEEPPGIMGVFMLNLFFAFMFIASGLLFRRASANIQIRTGL